MGVQHDPCELVHHKPVPQTQMILVVLLLKAIYIQTPFELRKKDASSLHSAIAWETDDEGASEGHDPSKKVSIIRLILGHKSSIQKEALSLHSFL